MGVAIDSPELLLTSSAEGAGSGSLHEAGGGRGDHIDVCDLPGRAVWKGRRGDGWWWAWCEVQDEL